MCDQDEEVQRLGQMLLSTVCISGQSGPGSGQAEGQGGRSASLALAEKPRQAMDKLDQLDEDCLIEVLDRLPQQELFKMLKVNKKLNEVATTKLRVQIKAITITGSGELFTFNNCYHLRDAVDCAITDDQVLFLKPKFKGNCQSNKMRNKVEAFIAKKRHLKPRDKSFDNPSSRALLFSWLAKCSQVKSINFGNIGNFKLPEGFLMEVVQRCPEIECLKMDETLVSEDEWERVMRQFGSKIVHFDIRLSETKKPAIVSRRMTKEPSLSLVRSLSMVNRSSGLRKILRLVEIVGENCPNIKQVNVSIDCSITWRLTSELASTLKKLPETRYVGLLYRELVRNAADQHFEDFVDNLFVQTLDWSAFGTRYDRLSELLVFCSMENPDGHGVDFAGLKVLKLLCGISSETLICLIESRFPQIEELRFNNEDLTEADYNALFLKMVSVKRLTIFNGHDSDLAFVLPQSAIRHLKNLETILVSVWGTPDNWQPKDFVEQLEKYLEIRSLKKLTVRPAGRGDGKLKKTVVSGINRLKVKQSRVKIELLN